ncbi:4-hydroxy-tetrahydrodipicolinate reductase [soil metagenome]
MSICGATRGHRVPRLQLWNGTAGHRSLNYAGDGVNQWKVKSNRMINIGIGGVFGRMGREIVIAAGFSSDITIVGGVVRPGSANSESVRYDFPVSSNPHDIVARSDVFIDFSLPEALEHHLEVCLNADAPYLSGVTGLGAEHRKQLTEASARIAVFYAANFSIGVAVMTELVRLAAAWMPDADVEVIDLHHRRKRDAPSGTALSLMESVESGRPTVERHRVAGRSGTGPRQPGEIGVHSLRGGGNTGEHRVLFASEGEEVWLGHRALNRATFADGALQAAQWLVVQPSGFYGMRDLVAERATAL